MHSEVKIDYIACNVNKLKYKFIHLSIFYTE